MTPTVFAKATKNFRAEALRWARVGSIRPDEIDDATQDAWVFLLAWPPSFPLDEAPGGFFRLVARRAMFARFKEYARQSKQRDALAAHAPDPLDTYLDVVERATLDAIARAYAPTMRVYNRRGAKLSSQAKCWRRQQFIAFGRHFVGEKRAV